MRGRVVAARGGPVVGAEVRVAGSDSEARTDSSGAFLLRQVPPGRRVVTVRHIGYAPLTDTVDVVPGGSQVAELILTALTPQMLDTVVVQENTGIPSFEEHRRHGLGFFLTRSELAAQENRRLSDILGQVPGLQIRNGKAGSVAWVYSRRRPITSIRRSSDVLLDESDVRDGATPYLCYAQVYIDQVPVYRGAEREPLYSINTLSPMDIEAIEYYAGPATTPARYARLNSQCGVLVIHRRRR